MAAGKLIVSTYHQYILIAVGVFLLVVFVRQLSGGFGHPGKVQMSGNRVRE